MVVVPIVVVPAVIPVAIPAIVVPITVVAVPAAAVPPLIAKMMAEILDALAKLVRLAARQAVTHPAIVKPLDMPGLAMQAVTFAVGDPAALVRALDTLLHPVERSEEHTSELQSLM